LLGGPRLRIATCSDLPFNPLHRNRSRTEKDCQVGIEQIVILDDDRQLQEATRIIKAFNVVR